ncbi:AMIN-like domain-containing (lipo)protein [Streptomyces lincolnensis]|uniref:AMIN-like domain-containing (lipo)protein n=1 Tax=Streptomyces lincolnensis TaxID=1915 RepID=UPI0037CCE72E
MRRISAAVAALVLAGAGLGAAATSAAAAPAKAAAACPTGWGSGDKGTVGSSIIPLTNVRAGQHECYDRLVFDVPGGGNAIDHIVGYVDEFHQLASGKQIPVAGGAILEVRVAAPSYDPHGGGVVYPAQAGQPLPGVDVSGYTTFRDTRFGASFEGETQIGLGVRARLPFRVIQLPDRLVVDVAHSWTSTG